LKEAKESFPDKSTYSISFVHDFDVWYIRVYDMKTHKTVAKYYHASYNKPKERK